MAGVIVLSSIVFAVLFCAAWLASPGLRAWIEQPKYQFQARVRRYDRGQRPHAPTDVDRGPS